MSRLRRMVWPVPVLIATVAAVAVGSAVLIHGWSLINWPVADWVSVSAEFHESLVVAAPLLAGCSAWLSASFTGRRSIVCPASATRSGVPIVARQLVVLIAAGLLGYAVGLTPIVVSTATRATTGGPDLLVLAGSVCALAVFAPIGYLAGAALPKSLSIVAAVVVSFAFVLAGGIFGQPALPLAPVWLTGLAEAGYHENTALSLFRLSFFVLLAFCAATAASRWVSGRSPASSRASATGLLILVLPAALALITINRPIEPLVRDLDPPRACDKAGQVEVCVHQAHTTVLDPLVQVVSKTLDSAGPSASRTVDQVLDAALWEENPPRRVSLHFQFQNGEAWTSDASRHLAGELAGTPMCSVMSRGASSGVSDEFAVAEAVTQWIRVNAGYGSATTSNTFPGAQELFERMMALPADEVRQWITEHHTELLNCDVRPNEML